MDKVKWNKNQILQLTQKDIDILTLNFIKNTKFNQIIGQPYDVLIPKGSKMLTCAKRELAQDLIAHIYTYFKVPIISYGDNEVLRDSEEKGYDLLVRNPDRNIPIEIKFHGAKEKDTQLASFPHLETTIEKNYGCLIYTRVEPRFDEHRLFQGFFDIGHLTLNQLKACKYSKTGNISKSWITSSTLSLTPKRHKVCMNLSLQKILLYLLFGEKLNEQKIY